MISLTPVLLPDNKQHPQETDNYFSGWIRTRNPSKRTTADPRPRARGHWDRLNICPLNAKVRAMATDYYYSNIRGHMFLVLFRI
jgi:hypothetical protein